MDLNKCGRREYVPTSTYCTDSLRPDGGARPSGCYTASIPARLTQDSLQAVVAGPVTSSDGHEEPLTAYLKYTNQFGRSPRTSFSSDMQATWCNTSGCTERPGTTAWMQEVKQRMGQLPRVAVGLTTWGLLERPGTRAFMPPLLPAPPSIPRDLNPTCVSVDSGGL